MKPITIWKEARLCSPYSKDVETYAQMIGYSERAVHYIESGHKEPSSAYVYGLDKVLNRPDVSATFCKEHCLIGQTYGLSVINKNLDTTVIHLMQEINHVREKFAPLIEIVSDNMIDEHEKEPLQEIMTEILHLDNEIENLKLLVSPAICLKSLIRIHNKERTTGRTVAFG